MEKNTFSKAWSSILELKSLDIKADVAQERINLFKWV
jgi:hypothetical protein